VGDHALFRVGRDAVVGAAARAIPKRGASNLTLAELAEALNVDEAAVTYWFQEPSQVLITLVEMRSNWFLDQARARMAVLETQAERLRELLEMSAADHDATFSIELWKLSLHVHAARVVRQSLADAQRRTIAAIIRAGQRTGEFGPASPDQVALVLASLISGFSVGLTLGDEAITPEVMLDTLLDVAERLLGIEFEPRPAA
jgi:AcrR family transcriptional regulator